jgi:G3E family GTPase
VILTATATVMTTSRIPVSVLTGFLGSGKTTLLSRLVRDPAMARAAVIINEFGEVGLDHLLVASADENTILMESGCLCCTMRSDIIDTLRDLDSRRSRGEVADFDRVVIETTGMADPAPILHTLLTDPHVAGRFRLAGVAATVDGVAGLAQLDRHEESVKQAALADRLIITKTDIAAPEEVDRLRARLRRLNPGGDQVDPHDDAFSPAALFDLGLYQSDAKIDQVARWLTAPHDHRDHEAGHHHDVDAFSITLEKPHALSRLLQFFEALARDEGDDLLRVKAILNVSESERPIILHGVQHIIYPPTQLAAWPPGPRKSQIVFIVQGVSPQRVRTLLNRMLPE